ncbi:hypothetical protein KEM52_005153 [Ascosphaera acerosa]|nr:hypothetical protein KEM52_005153 [Ascosphaera acerosa]
MSATASLPVEAQASQGDCSAKSTTKLTGRQLYEKMGCPKYVVAPMVDRSEFAWRMLTRSFMLDHDHKHDQDRSQPILAYTPMLHARLFNETESYRKQHFEPLRSKADHTSVPDLTLPSLSPDSTAAPDDTSEYEPHLDGNPAIDRPLIVQFCANDPSELLQAARRVEPYCDAVDLNLGCPQGIAKKGHYGSFLQEEPELIAKLVRTLHEGLRVPVTAKFRIQETKEKTLQYARMILDAGASIIAVHGRRREQKGHNTGVADWSYIRYLRDNLPPETVIFANGNVLCHDDLEKCIEATGADAVLSAEGVLSDPTIFAGPPSTSTTLDPCAYWRGRDGKGGYRMDYVLRRYMDILYKYVLEQDPPSRPPLFNPTPANLEQAIAETLKEEKELAEQARARTASGEHSDAPPAKKQKTSKARKEAAKAAARDGKPKPARVTSPNLVPIQGHLFQLLRPLVSKHTHVRDALAQARPGDMAQYEVIVGMVDAAVRAGLVQYARDPAAVEAEYAYAGDENGEVDYADPRARALACRRPWFVCQPYVRPLPEEALAIGAMKLSKKELKTREEAAEALRGESSGNDVQDADKAGVVANDDVQKENRRLEQEKRGLATPDVIVSG